MGTANSRRLRLGILTRETIEMIAGTKILSGRRGMRLGEGIPTELRHLIGDEMRVGSKDPYRHRHDIVPQIEVLPEALSHPGIIMSRSEIAT